VVPKSCPANPRTEWALRGAGPVTFSLTAVRAARAARGTLWPLAPPPCQVGSKPAGRGSFERHIETPAAGRGLNWSRRGRGPPLKFYVWPCRLHLKWIARPHLPPPKGRAGSPCCPTSGPPLGPLHRTQLPVRHIADHGVRLTPGPQAPPVSAAALVLSTRTAAHTQRA
jgi:hypothetical protein